MGYTTDFSGKFKFNKQLDTNTLEFLQKFAETRRMARDSDKLLEETGNDYGIEGEFYVDGDGMCGQGNGGFVLDHNTPPKTQPGLWCQWVPTSDGMALEHDGGEKFYNYVEWLEYLIKSVLIPRGYSLTGAVQWRGESFDDLGTIIVQDNKVETVHGRHVELPKAKTKKPVAKTVHIRSRKIDGMTYFRADTLFESLKLVKAAGGGIDLAIAELKKIANK